MSEKEVRKFAEDYIKAREKGDGKWLVKYADTKAMWETNVKSHKEMGWEYTETLEEFQNSYKSGISLLKVEKNKLTIGEIKIEGDTAEVVIDHEGAETMTNLMLSKASGEWMYTMGPTWIF